MPKARPKPKSLSQFRDAKRSDSKSRVHSSSTSGAGCITALETDCGAEVCPVEKDIYYFDIMYECTHHKTYKNTSTKT